MLFQKAIGAKVMDLSYTFNTVVNDAANRSTYTFTAVNVGAAHPTRIVYVVIIVGYDTAAGVVNSVSVGGVSATLVVKQGDATSPANNFVHCGIWKVALPEGTTATIEINSTIALRATAATYSVYHSDNATVAIGRANGSNVTAIDMSVAGGAAPSIIIAAGSSTTTPGSYSWSAEYVIDSEEFSLAVTENFDSLLEARINTAASLIWDGTSAVTITATRNVSSARYTAVAARVS